MTQLHRSLMDVGVDRIEIRRRLRRSYLRERLECRGENVYLRGREACLDLQRERRRRTRELLEAHRPLSCRWWRGCRSCAWSPSPGPARTTMRPMETSISSSFVEANAWVAERFPNFFWMRRDAGQVPAAGAPRWLEAALDLGLASTLEALCRRVLGARFRRRWDGSSGVVLSPQRLKLHPVDHAPGLRAAFAEVVERAEADE